MENNIKAQLFAMYLHQKVFVQPPATITGVLTGNAIESNMCMHQGYLLLRPVSMLTDEECLNVQSFRGWNDMLNGNGNISAVRRWIAEDINGDFNRRDFDSTLAIIDYLRSIGIALSVTVLIDCKPTTLTLQQLCDEGWVKLVER